METTLIFLFFILVWGILGVTFLCIGIGLHVRGRKKRNICTLPVTATVEDLRRKMENGHENSSNVRYTWKLYRLAALSGACVGAECGCLYFFGRLFGRVSLSAKNAGDSV